MFNGEHLEKIKVIADLHIHSRYSRATSEKMNIKDITKFAQIKGLNLIGTGDFTHPEWFKELESLLIEAEEDGLYIPTYNPDSHVRYAITGEVSTVFVFKTKIKKIHHVILTPSLETADQIKDRLARYGNLKADGRPLLDMTAPQLVEEVIGVSKDNLVIPAHVWTPWFGLFGAFSGFNRIEDCYQDMSRHIYALETGLSSDPPMNWRLSALDKFTLVSNSDSHSSWPWRLGREANVFELNRFNYHEVVDAIRKKDPNRLRFTIETNPSYGKYHWTGHRNCGVSLSPTEAIKFGNRCPVCGRNLTKGVEQRVEELADRPSGFKPQSVPGYRHLLPLSEIIATVLGVTYPGVKRVWSIYNRLITKFGDEYSVLLEGSLEDISRLTDPSIAKAIVDVREAKVKVIPGYDGVYGQLVFEGCEERKEDLRTKEKSPQKSMFDFL